MEGYESIFITDPDLSEEVQAGVLEKIKNIISQKGGEVQQYHAWGRRRFAYLINKKTHGDYHLMYLTGGEDMLKELAQQYRFTEEIIRFQTIKVEDIQKESEFFLELCKKETKTETTNTATRADTATETAVTTETDTEVASQSSEASVDGEINEVSEETPSDEGEEK